MEVKPRDRFEWIARVLSDAIWDLDLVTGTIEWSFGVRRQFGYSQAGDYQWWADRLHPEDRARVLDGIQCVVQEASIWADEYRFRHADGHWCFVHDRGIVIRNTSGQAIRMLGAMTDVTEHRLLEARLALNDRIATIGRLAAGLAHEINNPLATVLGNLDLINEVLPQPGDWTGMAIRQAIEAARRIAEISKDLATMIRPDEQRMVNVDAASLLEASVRMVRNELRHRAQVKVTTIKPCYVYGREGWISQLFFHLVFWAAEGIPEGHATEYEILIQMRPDEQNILIILEVPGVCNEDLAITGIEPSRDLTHMLGGTLDIYNLLHSGRTICVRLPKVDPPLALEALPFICQHKLRILVIDDEQPLLDLVAQVLGVGHQVETNCRAADAIVRFEAGERFDVILCDLMMPEMTGIEFYDAISKHWPNMLERILFLTGGAFTPAARQFIQDKPNRYLDKPFRLVELREAVMETAARAQEIPSR